MCVFPKFYPIVPDITHLRDYIKWGVKFVQIRLKDKDISQVRYELCEAITLAKKNNVTLVVNDYWQEALEYGADYVHLGQEDVVGADVMALKKAGIKLGLSTHDGEELDYALSFEPDYIALGPVYFTQLKAMKWQPQGLDKVTQWKQKTGDIPLVAIGGITLERAEGVLRAGADCVSVVTDITLAQEKELRLKSWLEAEKRWH